MSRSMGMVEWADGRLPSFFIHSNTTGISGQALLPTADEALEASEQRDAPAASESDPEVFVVRKTIAWGLSFVAGEQPMSEQFALATEKRLLAPRELYDDDVQLLRRAGVLHLAQVSDVTFLGRIEEPSCGSNAKSDEADELVDLSEVYEIQFELCPACKAKFLRHRL